VAVVVVVVQVVASTPRPLVSPLQDRIGAMTVPIEILRHPHPHIGKTIVRNQAMIAMTDIAETVVIVVIVVIPGIEIVVAECSNCSVFGPADNTAVRKKRKKKDMIDSMPSFIAPSIFIDP
jgi:hypothetical protein